VRKIIFPPLTNSNGSRAPFFGHGRPTALMKSNTQANLYRNRFSKGFRRCFADSPLLQPANLSQPKAEHCLVHRGRNRFNNDLRALFPGKKARAPFALARDLCNLNVQDRMPHYRQVLLEGCLQANFFLTDRCRSQRPDDIGLWALGFRVWTLDRDCGLPRRYCPTDGQKLLCPPANRCARAGILLGTFWH
jgi:hypothetical protein